MNTVSKDVLAFVQKIGCGKFGENLFYGRVPNSNKVPVALWWLTPSATNVSRHNVSGEDTISYRFELSYRNVSLEKVDQELFRITKEIVGSHCYNLDNFHTLDIELISAFPRIDIDVENRAVGTVSFDVSVYNILDSTESGEGRKS